MEQTRAKLCQAQTSLASYQLAFVLLAFTEAAYYAYLSCLLYLTIQQSWEKTFPGGWVGVVGLAENKANSAQLELELGLSLAIILRTKKLYNLSQPPSLGLFSSNRLMMSKCLIRFSLQKKKFSRYFSRRTTPGRPNLTSNNYQVNWGGEKSQWSCTRPVSPGMGQWEHKHHPWYLQ